MAVRRKALTQRVPSDDTASSQDADVVAIDYIKGVQFRTIHPDGALSALTAQGRVEFAFFCERQAIPNRIVQKLNSDGSLGEITEVKTRGSVVREIDLVVALQPEVALNVANFILAALGAQARNKQDASPLPTKRRRKS